MAAAGDTTASQSHGPEPARRNGLETAGLWGVVLVCLAIGALPVLAPAIPTASGADGFSVDRAVEHVKLVAQEPHPMGTPESRRVRDYLVATLSDAGIEAELQTVTAPDYFTPGGGTIEISNVLARIAGTGGGHDAILLMAHYDTVPTTPGANDNGAAVAALLEVGRLLAAGPPANDVILLFTDGEEPTPRFGASAFVANHRWFSTVALAVNFEGIGVAGPALLVELKGPQVEMVSRLDAAVPDLVGFSFMTELSDLVGGAATDFDVFRDTAVPGYNFAFGRGSSIYHTMDDNISNLNRAGLAHQGSLALGIARGFVSLDVDPAASDGGAFFVIGPGWVVNYGSAVAVTASFLAIALAVAALWLAMRRGTSSPSTLARGFGLALLGALVMVVIVTLGWVAVVDLGGARGLVSGYLSLVVMLALLAVGSWLVYRRAATTGADAAGGFVAAWLLLAVLLGLFLPAMGYLFVWPVIAAAIAALLAPHVSGYGGRLALLVMVALPTAAIVVPAIDTLFSLASPRPGNPGSEIPATIALALLLGFLAWGLVAARMRSPASPS